MTFCDDVQAGMDDYLDGTIEGARLTRLEDHLRSCSGCSADLIEHLRARRVTGEVFSAQIAQAPPVPGDLAERMLETLGATGTGVPIEDEGSRDSARRRGSRSLFAFLATAAAVLIVAVTLALYPRSPVEASPVVALARAAEHYKALEDVELWVRFDSPAIRALELLFGQNKKSEKPGVEAGDEVEKKEGKMPDPLRIYVQAPTRFLYQQVEDLAGPRTEFLTLGGYNGEQNWSFDREKNVVELGPDNGDQLSTVLEFKNTKLSFKPDSGAMAEGLNLMSFLSWGFLTDLKDGKGYDVTEITWPADRRAGRRVFRIEPQPAEDGKSKFVWGGATVTIDARDELIERMVIELNLGPVSLFTVNLEVAATNQGLEADLFEYATHVPPGTEVVEYKEEPEEGEGEGEEEKKEEKEE